jgi:apolipoprotein D and lipocalin family protein
MITDMMLAVRNACRRGAPPGPPPATVAKVDLDRYLGTWFEVARLPNPEEDGYGRHCVDVTATYARRRNGTVDVLNVARNAKAGMRSTSVRGFARPVDATGAKLVVTFFRLFNGDYWVLGLDPEYRWALVGTPRRRRLWLLARTPALEPAEYERAMAIAATAGYDPARIVKTQQSAAG